MPVISRKDKGKAPSQKRYDYISNIRGTGQAGSFKTHWDFGTSGSTRDGPFKRKDTLSTTTMKGTEMPEDRTHECLGIMGALFGHNFKSRTTSKETISKDKASLARTIQGVEALKDIETTYHGDVCARCGKTTNDK